MKKVTALTGSGEQKKRRARTPGVED